MIFYFYYLFLQLPNNIEQLENRKISPVNNMMEKDDTYVCEYNNFVKYLIFYS